MYNQEVQEYINKRGFFTYEKLNSRLTPDDYEFLKKNFPKTMATITNGCKPGYLPRWLKINHCKKRKEACNFHDFLYWIAWFRKESDKLFLQKMNKKCSSWWHKLRNYRFWFYVRALGKTAFSTEEKTLDDFFRLELI